MLQIDIRVQGHIDKLWSAWFEDLKIIHLDTDQTVLTGTVRDQAAFYGLMAKLRDLGLSIQLIKCENLVFPDHAI